MPKFFIDTPHIHENKINISGDDAKHIVNVLRCKTGEEITLCDPQGFDYYCKIAEISSLNGDVLADVLEKVACENEPKTKITLFQGLPKADKMELVIQKAVELGVTEIVGITTERTIVKLDKKENKKIDRWQKISEAAAKQSYRGIIPEINNKILTFKEAVSMAKDYDLAIIPYENEEKTTLKTVLKDFNGKNIAVFIGSEGGFSSDEIDLAINSGLKSVTLGKRILRTETASISTIAMILYDLEG